MRNLPIFLFIFWISSCCTKPAQHQDKASSGQSSVNGTGTPPLPNGEQAAENPKEKAPDPLADKNPGVKSMKFAAQSCEINAATGACYLVDASLDEMSGIVASSQAENVFWVHNDEGPGLVYAINLRGEILSRQALTAVSLLDSEDITLGPGPKAGTSYIYLGDIGDSKRKAPAVTVLRFPEPTVDPNQKGVNGTVTDLTAITLSYTGEILDFETLFIDPIDGDLFLVQKAGYNVYKASKADLDKAQNGSIIPLSLVRSTGAWAIEPSGGNMSPAGDEIILRNETTAWIFNRSPGQKVEEALGTIALTLTLGKELNGEAVTFDNKGVDFYTVSENTLKKAKAPSPAQPVSIYRRLP